MSVILVSRKEVNGKLYLPAHDYDSWIQLSNSDQTFISNFITLYIGKVDFMNQFCIEITTIAHCT